MLMRENKEFFSFAFDSAHVKYDVWTWPYTTDITHNTDVAYNIRFTYTWHKKDYI